MKFAALVMYMLKETFSQKVIILLCIILNIILGILVLGLHIEASGGVVESVSIYGSKPFTATEAMNMLPIFVDIYVTFGFYATVVLCIVATAHMVPDILSNGTMVLFLSKPLTRLSIIIGMYCGITLAVALIQVYFLGGVCAIFAIKTGATNFSFIMVLIPLFLAFAVMFSLMELLSFITRSTGLIIAVALFHVVVLSNVLANREKIIFAHIHNDVLRRSIDALYYFLPQVSELRLNAVDILSRHASTPLPATLSALLCVAFLLITYLRFRKMDC
jgi:ABC-type transport system involved in multi-copper enzyme maturation permease subunit